MKGTVSPQFLHPLVRRCVKNGANPEHGEENPDTNSIKAKVRFLVDFFTRTPNTKSGINISNSICGS